MDFKPESTWFNTSVFEVRIVLLSMLGKFHSITSILFSVLSLLPKETPKMLSFLVNPIYTFYSNQSICRKIYAVCLLKTKNLKTFESNVKIFEKFLIYFGILEKLS